MQPPYTITPKILRHLTSISEKIGAANALHVNKPSPQLRKQNKIKTIQASLQIEGNTLSVEQVTALIENKPVIGPKKDITEVLNAIKAYEALNRFSSHNEKSFLKAHQLLMQNLVAHAGNYRRSQVGMAKGTVVAHLAPPPANVRFLMKQLFHYLKKSKEVPLIKSCVFHYEMEFIHPFTDGNGSLGRLWQTLILMEHYPIFEFLPFETLIQKNQKRYYKALMKSDQLGHPTPFIEFMLQTIDAALDALLNQKIHPLKSIDRIHYFLDSHKGKFSRKEYLSTFKNLSTATASRDLKKATDLKLVKRVGKDNKTHYMAFIRKTLI